MLSYPATITLSTRALNHLADLIRHHRGCAAADGERAVATLKTWKILVKLRCCPRRAPAIVQAILVLHHIQADRYPR